MPVQGELRGDCAPVHNLPLQQCEVEGPTYGGQTQRCQQPGQGQEPFPVAPVAKAAATAAPAATNGIKSDTEYQKSDGHVKQ